MQASTEARWFFDERENITSIERWFAGFGFKLNTVNFERRDYYLKLPGVNEKRNRSRTVVLARSSSKECESEMAPKRSEL